MGLQTPYFSQDIDEWIATFEIMTNGQIRHGLNDPNATAQAQQTVRVDQWHTQQNEETLRMTSLLDLQQYYTEGTFPARKSKRYGNLTSFAINFRTDGTPTRDVRISPDDCKTVTELKDHIKVNTIIWYGESFVLNTATLEVDDEPDVQDAKLIKFSIENNEEWQQWREKPRLRQRGPSDDHSLARSYAESKTWCGAFSSSSNLIRCRWR